MSDTAISVEGLGKSYRIGKASGRARYKTLREQLARSAAAPFRAVLPGALKGLYSLAFAAELSRIARECQQAVRPLCREIA
jgi:uncharacterized protein (DUF2267 family)